MKVTIFDLCFFIGLILIFGTAGKSDTNDLMPLSQILSQCLIGILLMVIGFIPLKVRR